jgi:hypothetical protein
LYDDLEQSMRYLIHEDAAEVILDNLSKSGRFSRRHVGVALPLGLRSYKADVPR